MSSHGVIGDPPARKEVNHATVPVELGSPSLEAHRSNSGQVRVTTHAENKDRINHVAACAALQMPPLQAESRDDERRPGAQGAAHRLG